MDAFTSGLAEKHTTPRPRNVASANTITKEVPENLDDDVPSNPISIGNETEHCKLLGHMLEVGKRGALGDRQVVFSTCLFPSVGDILGGRVQKFVPGKGGKFRVILTRAGGSDAREKG